MSDVHLAADYIVVGGGLTGCAVASRLSQAKSSPSVILLEAGIDAVGHPHVTTPADCFKLQNSELDWAFKTEVDPNTNGRVHTVAAGKVLGGGSVLNYGGWLRADAADYDEWAKAVGDDRWSYEKQLHYLRKTENFLDVDHRGLQHGFGGPFHVSGVEANVKRRYGLREPLRAAWEELGVRPNAGMAQGLTTGLSGILENWRDGKRQPSHLVYDLAKVQVITAATVQQVLFTTNDSIPKASSVLLLDGRQIKARKEIVLTAGAMRSPQLLLLSGIGPSDTLTANGIQPVVPSHYVGANLTDHLALYQFWKVRDPSKNLSLGNPHWNDVEYEKGLPWDWVATESVPDDQLQGSIRKDQAEGKLDKVVFQGEALLEKGRSHVETMILYSTLGAPVPIDGSLIASSVMLLLPSSRGKVSIRSASAADPPVIIPNYLSTATDLTTMIYGARRLTQLLLGTSAGKDYIECEATPPGVAQLTAESTTVAFEERIRQTAMAQFHSAGTAAMGRVVDTHLCVYGVQGLRVADASVLPVAIGGHPQATLYALAEQASDLILEGS